MIESRTITLDSRDEALLLFGQRDAYLRMIRDTLAVRLIARGDTFSGELAKFSPALLAGLRERGIELKTGHAENSGLHGVVRLADGSYEGAADSRREGVARMLPAHVASRHAGAK